MLIVDLGKPMMIHALVLAQDFIEGEAAEEDEDTNNHF